jgi:hypothetical protein
MDDCPLAKRFLIRTLMLRYLKMLKKLKDVHKISDKQFDELCERFIHPEFVLQVLEMMNKKVESDSEDSDDSE